MELNLSGPHPTRFLKMSAKFIMKISLFFCCVIVFAANPNKGFPQNKDITFSKERDLTLKQALKIIHKQTDYRFVYDNRAIETTRVVTVKKGVIKTKDLLSMYFEDADLTYEFQGEGTIVVKRKSQVSEESKKEPDNQYEQTQISGTVTDSSGQPLPGASVVEKATTNGVQTDFDGNFSITMSGDTGILVVSYVGFRAKEIVLDSSTSYTIVLEEDTARLDEVIVIGYGTQKKSDLTGSVASISEEELATQKTTSVDQLIQGRAAGVQVTQVSAAPGGAASIRVRGGNSIVGGNEPLYVVDGFPLYSSAEGNATNPLAAINPNNIASIEILKDASATAIYGSRGANGVVLITTKSGAKGKGKIDINVYSGIQTVREKLDLMGSRDFATLANERAVNDGLDIPFADVNGITTNTDWQDLIFREAYITNLDLTFSGGNEKSTYSINGNLFNQDGIIIDTGFKRASFGLNLDQSINDNIRVKTSINASKTVNDRAEVNDTALENTVNAANYASPTLEPFQEDGSFTDLQDFAFADPLSNPLAQALDVERITEISRLLGTVAVEMKLNEAFQLTGRLGIDFNNFFDDNYLGRTVRFGEPAGSAIKSSTENTSYLAELLLDYNKVSGDHKFNAVGGVTWQNEDIKFILTGANGFVSDDLQGADLSAGENPRTPESGQSKSLLLSGLGRFNYIYKDKYLFTLTGRADGSSRFGNENKWGFFPSGSFAWRISNEDFLQSSETISNLKLRLSYGLSGNQEIGSYQSLSRIESNNYILGAGDNLAIGLSPANIGNPDLKWETTAQFNAGMDFGFFNGRLNFVTDYYIKKTTDLLVERPLPSSSGFSSVLENVGEIENVGFEFAVDATPFSKEFYWSINANIAFNRNEVISLGESSEFFGATLDAPLSTPVNLVREGEELGAFFGFQTEDLLSEAGDIVYVDINGDGTINGEDRTIIGSPYPDFIYGLTSSMKYKNFDLSFFWQGVQGGDIFNFNRLRYADPTGSSNQLVEVNDRWSQGNPNREARYPRVSGSTALLASDRLLESASFLRLKNLTFGYRVDMENSKFLTGARIYLTGQNLITITDYSGYDPEVSVFGGGTDLRIGIDAGSYPTNKSIILGLQLQF